MATELMPPSPQTNFEVEGPSIGDYLGMIRRRLGTILLPGILLAIVGGIVAFVVPNQYEDKTVFTIEDPGVLLGVIGSGSKIVPHKPLLLRAQDEIKSPAFLRPIINKIGLTEGYNTNSPKEMSQLFDYIDKNLKVRVDPVKQGADRIILLYRGRNQARVTQFLDAVRESYRDLFRDRYRRAPRDYFTQAEAALTGVAANLSRKEADLQAFLATSEADYLDQGGLLARQAEFYSEELEKKRALRGEAEVKLQKAENQLRKMNPRIEKDIFIENEEKKLIRAQLSVAEGILDNLVVVRGLTEQTEEVQVARREVQRLKDYYESVGDRVRASSETIPDPAYAEQQTLINALRRDIDGFSISVNTHEKSLKDAKASLAKVPEAKAKYGALTGEVDGLQSAVTRARRTHGQASESWRIARDTEFVRVLKYPRGNDPPVFPSVPLFVLIGLAAGLLIGAGVAFVQEFSGMTYATAAQVKSSLPVPVLGQVARIETEEETRAESRRKFFWIFGTITLILVIAVIHYFYFTPDLAPKLPNGITSVMDAIYIGR